MSKNSKIRRATDTLPRFPKFNVHGRVIRDRFGRMQWVDHFKVINELRKESKKESVKNKLNPTDAKKVEDKMVLDYMKKVRSYDVTRGRKKQKEQLLWVITGAILSIAAIIFTLIK